MRGVFLANVSVYAMFCGVKRSKIWKSEVQRANRIYCVRRAERSDSGVRVQRALRIFEKFIHIIPFLVGFLLLYLIFFEKWKRGWGVNSIFQNSLLYFFYPKTFKIIKYIIVELYISCFITYITRWNKNNHTLPSSC